MAKTLWDDLKFHAGIAGDNFLEKSTIGKLLKGTYDSTYRLTHPTGDYSPTQAEDAFNVAGFAMGGGMPGVPKGNSPSTLGMAFRRPQDVVYTTKGEFNPTSSTLKEDFGDNYDLYNLISRYHNKTWGTMGDPVIQHIDKGFKVPEIPGLDTEQLWPAMLRAKIHQAEGASLQPFIEQNIKELQEYGDFPLQAKTELGKYVESHRDRLALFQNTGIPNSAHVYSSRGMPQKTKDYARNTDGVNVFSKPEISSLASTQLPYKIDGNLNRMSLADMLMQASEKEAALARIPPEKLHEFDDGHYWTQLKTQAQREAESDAMGNSTRLPMHDGKDLYSLRNKNGRSILTASRWPNNDRFDEIKNNGNHVDVLNKLRQGTGGYEYFTYTEALRERLGLNRKW